MNGAGVRATPMRPMSGSLSRAPIAPDTTTVSPSRSTVKSNVSPGFCLDEQPGIGPGRELDAACGQDPIALLEPDDVGRAPGLDELDGPVGLAGCVVDLDAVGDEHDIEQRQRHEEVHARSGDGDQHPLRVGLLAVGAGLVLRDRPLRGCSCR